MAHVVCGHYGLDTGAIPYIAVWSQNRQGVPGSVGQDPDRRSSHHRWSGRVETAFRAGPLVTSPVGRTDSQDDGINRYPTPGTTLISRRRRDAGQRHSRGAILDRRPCPGRGDTRRRTPFSRDSRTTGCSTGHAVRRARTRLRPWCVLRFTTTNRCESGQRRGQATSVAAHRRAERFARRSVGPSLL